VNLIKDLKKILSNDRGIALMMIMTSIIILMAVYGEFTFESKISRIKATNVLDRSQAKLLADSGLQLAVTRLRLYKEAFNRVQGNQNIQGQVPPQLLNQLWEVPFIYPVPVAKGASRAFIDTVEKFQKETLLEGEMRVSIQNISNRLNLNLLRLDMTKIDPANFDAQEASSLLNMNNNAIMEDVSIDQALFFLLKRLVDEKKEKDDGFQQRYANINYQELVTNLKYYISDFQSMMTDPLAGEAERIFQRIPLSPKYGPLGSASELYAIPGWDDELIQLIQNEFSVYPAAQIDLNKLTANMLMILIPNIQEPQIRDFFEWRDGDPENPKFLNSLQDFKRYVVNIASLMGDAAFDERMKMFTDRKISFGSNPNLFKVVSEGVYNRSTYTLVAYVVLPKQESLQPTTPPGGGNPPGGTPPEGTPPEGTPPGGGGPGTPNQGGQLLEPQIIEIQVN
jgi:type II secretory pathway component PulK